MARAATASMRRTMILFVLTACTADVEIYELDDNEAYDDDDTAYIASGSLGPHQAPPFRVTDATDVDGDGLADQLERYLAAQFAPQLLLPPDDVDWTRPANVGWYLARVHMRFDHPNCSDHQVLALGAVTVSSVWQQEHHTSSGVEPFCSHNDTVYHSGPVSGTWTERKSFFLQPENDAVHRGIPPDRKSEWRVYTHVQNSGYPGAAYDVQVWTFYAYNDFFGSINHEADWEHITISVSSDLRPVSVYFASHSAGERFNDPAQLRWSGRTHPIGYVADGSHAIYATAGAHASPVPGVSDHCYDGGPVWNTWANFVNLGERGRIMNDQRAWARYDGRWGEVGTVEDTSGPVGPMYSGRWIAKGNEY
jgi:hypothetical protein